MHLIPGHVHAANQVSFFCRISLGGIYSYDTCTVLALFLPTSPGPVNKSMVRWISERSAGSICGPGHV